MKPATVGGGKAKKKRNKKRRSKSRGRSREQQRDPTSGGVGRESPLLAGATILSSLPLSLAGADKDRCVCHRLAPEGSSK
jgi:hypothetical protein